MEKLGKYDIVDKIGVGGFGVVFRGYDPFIKRHVAIKTCSAEDRETRDRFMREAEIAGNLQHRNIVTVFEFGFHGETPYLVQEFLSGEDLDHKIRRGDAIPVAEKIRWLCEIGRGLEFAHSRGVVHRDIKPANIRILDDGSAKILDFGIAKLAQQQSNLTQVGVTLGTASYLAPEQIRGEAVDVRTDIFSFGVMAYELLTYERPFRAQEISATFYKILNERPTAIVAKAPGTPAELEQVVLRCLEKDPAKRYSPSYDLVQALENLDRKPSGALRGSEDRRSSGDATGVIDEKTSALKPSMVATASRPIPIPSGQMSASSSGSRATGATATPSMVNSQSPTMALSDMVLESSRSGPRPESYGMAPASMQAHSKWPKIFGIVASLVAATFAVLFFANQRKDSHAATPGTETTTAATDTTTNATTATPAAPAGADLATSPAPVAPVAPGTPIATTPGSVPAPTTGAPPAVPAPVPAPAPAPAPEPEPPKPAILVLPQAWDPAMTARVAGKSYTLDRERRVELEAQTVRVQFVLENPNYQFEKELRIKLGEGETERVSIPIVKPGRLTVQPHLNSRPGSVRIDGQMVGTAPVRGRWVEPGEHFVEILAVGGGGVTPVISKSVMVKSDVESILSFDIDLKLEPTLREKPIGGP